MTLECTLVRGPAAAETAAPEELTIAVSLGTSGVHVQSLLKEARGTGRLSVNGRDLSTLTVGLPPLVSGAVVVDGATSERHPEAVSLPMMLLTQSGPSAGSIFRIQRGRFHIGRGSSDISIPDPGMSRDHAVLEVSSTAVTLRDVVGANPLFVDDQPIRRGPVTSASSVRCGNSTFTVFTENGPLPAISTAAGCSVEEPIEVLHTKSPGNRLAMVLGAALPLIAGIGLAVATGMWMYLGFTAISAVSLLVPVIAGRRSRRECRLAVARAAQEDIERRRRCSPSAAEIVVAAHGRAAVVGLLDPEPLQGNAASLAAGSTNGIGSEVRGGWVRLGSMRSRANIRLVPDDPHFRPPPIGSAAVTLDPRHPLVTLRGQSDHVDALLRYVVMQLASYPSSAEACVIILGRVGRLPLSARFLPRVALTTDHAAALAALNQMNGRPSGRLIIIDDPATEEADSVSLLLKSARRVGCQVILCCVSSERPGPVMEIDAAGTAGCLEMGGERLHFIPDLVPADVFDQFCRSVAATTSQDEPTSHVVPDHCSLADLLPFGQRRILRRWGDTALRTGLSAVLGQGRDGRVTFDFKVDGPHLLVAGTTGSGKSELLRTLVASMALSDSPERTTFMFFDFKGGSGLRPLASLPHCVGLLTDLSEHHLDRALVSLRGEIRHREELFAAAEVSDLAQYRLSASNGSSPVPHLVLVIDEFRMLVDEAPGALRELMRVATIGRSLGIHLVMATQRPQGALTADIRANVTSSIALRVQSEVESVDIINSKAAASIRVDAPGRAYLARASSSPDEFQTASLSVSPGARAVGGPHGNCLQLVQTAKEALEGSPDAWNETGGPNDPSDAGAEWVVSTVHEAWRRLSRPLPRRPVAAPLPTSIHWHGDPPVVEDSRKSSSNAGGQWVVGPLGLLDRPAQQVVEPLLWLPSEHGHLAMIGSPSSGMQNCFRATSAMLATRWPQPHLYILDATGILGHVAEQGRIGATAGLHQVPLAARVLKRLAAELEHRRTLIGGVEKSSPPLVLIVAGWCSWATTLRTGPFGWAEGVLQDIVRDGCAFGITVLISGERELVSSRLFAAIPNRAYFPSGSTEESRFHWPRLPEVESIPGRAVVIGDFVEGHTAVAQFREAPSAGLWPFSHLIPAEPLFRVRPLPERLDGEDFQARLKAFPMHRIATGQDPESPTHRGGNTRVAGKQAGNLQTPLWIGVGGDDVAPVSLPLRAGGVSVILGSHRSGKSSALGSLHSLNPSVPWVYPGHAISPGTFWASVAREAEAGTLDPNSILLVDDADTLDAQGRQALATLTGKVRGIVLSATSGPALVQHLPLVREVQTSSMGLVLGPLTPHDGDLLGVRLEADRAGHPGRGFIINGSEVSPFQGALTTGFPPPAQPSSGARACVG